MFNPQNIHIDAVSKSQTQQEMQYLGSSISAKSGIQITVGSKSVKLDFIVNSQITHTYTLQETHTFPPFVLKQYGY